MSFSTSHCPEQPDLACRVALLGAGFGDKSPEDLSQPKSLHDAMVFPAEYHMKGKAQYF